jgi:hypothetical protein
MKMMGGVSKYQYRFKDIDPEHVPAQMTEIFASAHQSL